MHTHRYLFERICTPENLLAAAHDALRGKRQRGPGFRFWMELEPEICALHDELCAGIYQHGPYTYFTIHEPKERLVAAAPFRDRVVHHAIVRVIEPIFERRFIEDSFACRRGKGTHADDVRQEWPPGGDLFDVQWRKRGLPIGNLTSQFFANVYLNPLDHFVKHALRVKGYVRYLDDFLLFGQDRATLRRQGAAVREKLAELRLDMHPDKYRLVPTRCGVDFAGYVVFADGRVRVRSSSVRRFDRRYRRMLWQVRHRFIKPAKVTESVCAWVAHARHAQSYGLRGAVLSGRSEAGWPG